MSYYVISCNDKKHSRPRTTIRTNATDVLISMKFVLNAVIFDNWDSLVGNKGVPISDVIPPST